MLANQTLQISFLTAVVSTKNDPLKKNKPDTAYTKPKLVASISVTVVLCEINIGIRNLCLRLTQMIQVRCGKMLRF